MVPAVSVPRGAGFMGWVRLRAGLAARFVVCNAGTYDNPAGKVHEQATAGMRDDSFDHGSFDDGHCFDYGHCFSDARPWGTHLPEGRGAFWLAVARAFPGSLPWSRFALLARMAARRHLTGPVDAQVWGQRLRLFPDRSISEARILFLPRAWDRAERRVLAGWVTPGFTFVDVGANVGGYAFWMLSRLEMSGRVVAVEPNPELCRQLRFNVSTNKAEERVQVVEAAVGAERGTGTLLIGARNSGESRLIRTDPGGGAGPGPDAPGPEAPGATIPVDVVTLADVVSEAGLRRIDCLKVDVEGHEAAVIQPYLRGSPRVLWPQHLIVELGQAHRNGKPSPGLADWLVARGYRPVLRTRLNGLFKLA